MKKLFFLICLGVSSLYGGDFYGIIIADTQAGNIGNDVCIDLLQMSHTMRTISVSLERPFKQVVFTGNEVDGQTIAKKISKLDIGEEDLVFFYFSGHGQRAAIYKNDPWPLMIFSTGGMSGLNFSEMVLSLLEKKPQFLLALADCCNTYQSLTPALVTMLQAKGGLEKDREIAGIYQLFETQRGMIMACGSEPGEPGWSTFLGGAFTINFLNSYRMELQEEFPSWEVIFEKTREQLEDIQHPQVLQIPSNEEARTTLLEIIT